MGGVSLEERRQIKRVLSLIYFLKSWDSRWSLSQTLGSLVFSRCFSQDLAGQIYLDYIMLIRPQ